MGFNISDYQAIVDELYQLMEKHAGIADVKLAADKWTLKEMVGHLIDSASNNHQRFIRLQLESRLIFPAYDAEEWKSVSRVGSLDYGFLVQLWKQYNALILHIIQQVGPEALSNCWEVNNTQKSLGYLIQDYFEHLKFHRTLFAERAAEIEARRREG